MKNILLIFIIFSFLSCKDGIVSPDGSGNLITNSSFEISGSPSLRGWEVSGNVKFYRDTPPRGGSYSIGIDESWGVPNYAAYPLAAKRGTSIYYFSCWAKVDSLPASIKLALHQDTIKYFKEIAVTDTLWRFYSITDTITASRGESIKIFLNGSISQLLPSTTYYDRCFLEIR
jgi:hypothetical protein